MLELKINDFWNPGIEKSVRDSKIKFWRRSIQLLALLELCAHDLGHFGISSPSLNDSKREIDFVK